MLNKFVALLLIVGVASALKNTPECDLKKAARDCIKTGFLIGENKVLPKNDDEMNKMCDNVKLSEDCAKKFMDDCSDSEKDRNRLDIAIGGMIRSMKGMCDDDARKARFLNNMKDCGNAILQDARDKCTKVYKKQLLVAAEMDDKDKIKKVMCCKVKDLTPCIKTVMDGKSECTDDNKKFVDIVRKTMSDELTSKVCGDFKAETECAGVDVAEFRGNVDDESLTVAMKKILDKLH